MNALDAAWRPDTATGLPAGTAALEHPPLAHQVAPPCAPEREARLHLLDAIAEILRTAGSGVTDIAWVAAMARIPARRIDEEFGGMDGLVVALVEQLCATVLEPLATVPTADSFRAQLRKFADRLVDAYASSHLRALHRIALTAAIRHTGIGRRFYQRGPGLLVSGVARFIRDAHEAGVIHAPNSFQLASHFVALLRGDLDLREEAAGLPARGTDHVVMAIELFHSGIRMGERNARTDR